MASRAVKVHRVQRVVRQVANEIFYNKTIGIEQRIQDCVDKRDKLNERIKRLEEVKSIWDNLPFKEGDVAVHIEFGNILIKSIEFGTTEDDLEDIKYNIITCNHGIKKISFREIVAMTEAAKVLYVKK